MTALLIDKELFQELVDEVYSMQIDRGRRWAEYSYHEAHYRAILKKLNLTPHYIKMEWDGERWTPDKYNKKVSKEKLDEE